MKVLYIQDKFILKNVERERERINISEENAHFSVQTISHPQTVGLVPSLSSWWCLQKMAYPKNHWTLQWRGLNLYSRGPGPQSSHF